MPYAPSGLTPTEVAVCAEHGSAVELELIYDGTFPPQTLFDALEASGWEHPVVVPPPASAIDWSTPDPIKGTRYTVLPYRAVSRVALVGSDRSGRAVELAMATAHAHGAMVPDRYRPGVTLETGPTSPTPDDAGSVATLTVVLPIDRVDVTLTTLGEAVVLVDQHPTTVKRTHSYRGRSVETEAPATELVLRVRSGRLADVQSELSRVASVAPTVTRG